MPLPFAQLFIGFGILYVKHLYPPSHDRELVRIVQRKFGYKTNHHTVKHFLARHASPVQLEFNLLALREFADAYHARWTVVRMWTEGWNKQSIAGCLKMARSHVYAIIAAFERDGFEGLAEHRTRPLSHPDNPLRLPFLKEVLDLQQAYPRAGRFRIHGLLAQQHGSDLLSAATVGRAMAINRRVHGAPGPWASARAEEAAVSEPRHLPYRPQYRHHLWFVDIRYLVKLDGHWIYSICIRPCDRVHAICANVAALDRSPQDVRRQNIAVKTCFWTSWYKDIEE
jgi:hypothetical protein